MTALMLLADGARAYAEEPPETKAASAILINSGGEVLYEKNADARSLIASTTKIMTALVTLESVGLDDPVEIRPEWCGIEGSSMYLAPGEVYTVRELLIGLMLVSGNDAASALAGYVAGGDGAFAERMNAKAAELGMTDSHFANPHGLNAEGHYSTARDMARLMAHAMENPDFAAIAGLKSSVVGEQTLSNHNKLLWRCPGCIGGKTGFTEAAGRCLVSCCERAGTRLICVTLADPDDWNDHERLYAWGFASFSNRTVTEGVAFEVPVISGAGRTVRAVPEAMTLFLPNAAELTLRAELPRFVFAPVEAGERAGTLTVLLDGVELGRTELVYEESVSLAVRTNKMTERLQKIIAASGLMSRRAAEEQIAAGRVTVNGQPAALGDRADAAQDQICIDGRPLLSAEEKVYIMLNKPRGYVTTLRDEKGRRNVTELLRGVKARVYPVGRLDMDSEGLLLLTNDGDFANRLMHPSHEIGKTYQTWVQGTDIGPRVELLREPMEIDGYWTSPAQVEIEELLPGGAVLTITIHEGRNRQVRKMCEQAGLRVTRLRRVSEGPLRLGELKTGQWRYLTAEELAQFRG